MITAAQLAAIEDAAQGWVDRPELRCQFAMAGIYKDADLLPLDLEIPEGPRDLSRSSARSLIIPWVDQCGYFEVIEQLEPGALVCFRLGHSPHHVAIYLSGGRLVHVYGTHGVKIGPCIPAPWVKRIEKIWRIRG